MSVVGCIVIDGTRYGTIFSGQSSRVRFTTAAYLALSPVKRKSERLDDGGSLVIWHKLRKSGGVKEFYFRKIHPGGSETNIKIGVYPTINLARAHKDAKELSKKAASCVDLRFLLAEEDRERVEIELATKR